MRNTMELAVQRRADLMEEMRKLDAFMEMARQLEREAGSKPAPAETSRADEATDADRPMAGWRPAQRETAQPEGETEAGRAIVQGFKPRTQPDAEPVTVAPKHEATPKREDAPVENMFA